MKGLTDSGLIQKLDELARRSQGSIQIEPLPTDSHSVYPSKPEDLLHGTHRTLRREIAVTWRMSSFSSLTAGLPYEQNAYIDRDFFTGSETEAEEDSEAFKTLFNFPKGARAGLFFHDLLEHWDHTDVDPTSHKQLVSSLLTAHGFDSQWQAVIQKMLGQLSNQSLRTKELQFTLSKVAMTERNNEMEFYYPIKPFTSRQMKQCFGTHSHRLTDGKMEGQLERLTFEPMQGFMKGYIDTVFQYQQKYYLVDWKSNHLGDHFDDYRPAQLSHVMVEDFYFLQYHLYTVALNRYLRQTIPNYDYQSHFGGVFYLFLRGIGGRTSDDCGVFFDKPQGRLISDLEALLIGMEPY